MMTCHHCGKPLHPGRGGHYLVRIDALADPAPPTFTEEDFAIDFDEEFRRLVDQLENLTEQEALDQVYRRVILALCTACYRRWIEDPTGRGNDLTTD